MVTAGPSTASGGMMTLPRDPSGRRKSMYGADAETDRPVGRSSAAISNSNGASPPKSRGYGSMRPWRSM